MRSIVAKVGFDPLIRTVIDSGLFRWRSFSCIYAYDASIICNDIIDGFLLELRYTLLGASLAGL